MTETKSVPKTIVLNNKKSENNEPPRKKETQWLFTERGKGSEFIITKDMAFTVKIF
jgi:hypothetical protein